ncbi:uncharacterized protein RHTO_06475 [Rhodotorula toruloides NP11]|uniref:F-box domain-containing protein n=1 Tax=Rhodotorula toruloides (strain NP11) TaxID=1130832 RepID=M7WD69_RHOT1|nr:uncharacterized protein RHTO_06475 [Rhodotorula toruloides NP11]EMS18332.1 hypothetical protein RHTO_06475 [Rhodotorula toruloides NP11]
MPVPSLPIELVDLIISHVARGLSQSERHTECGRLALVCKDWTERARMVAWRQLHVHVTSDAKLIDHLCRHPHLACYIHNISPSVPWMSDIVGSRRGESLLDVLRRARPTDVTLPISRYTRRFFLAAAHALNTERLRDLTCFGAIGDSETLANWAEGLRDMPLLRILSVLVTGEEQDTQPVRSRNLDMRIAVRVFDFTVCGDADSEAMSTLFRALCGMLADELEACALRLPDPSALRLEPLKRFSNLTAVFLTVQSDSASVLYRLCDEAASLPHLAGLDVSHGFSVGEVYKETDILSNVVDVAEVVCRLPRTLPDGETLVTYVLKTSEGIGEWSLAFASSSVPATCVITAAPAR